MLMFGFERRKAMFWGSSQKEGRKCGSKKVQKGSGSVAAAAAAAGRGKGFARDLDL